MAKGNINFLDKLTSAPHMASKQNVSDVVSRSANRAELVKSTNREYNGSEVTGESQARTELSNAASDNRAFARWTCPDPSPNLTMVLSQTNLPEEPRFNASKRYYVSEAIQEHKYVQPADDEEQKRLNDQSQFIVHAFNNKLIWAPVNLKEDDMVPDSGTGSGDWLLSLAKERDIDHKFPCIKLLGIDISPRMFPPPSLHPIKTTFSMESITSLPHSWSNTVSLIHQRLLMLALQPSQWKVALAEMYRVLVPGGWIQVFEGQRLFESPSDEIVYHKAFRLRDDLCLAVCNVAVDIVDYLPNWIEEAGFVNLNIVKRGLPMGASWSEEWSAPGVQSIGAFWSALKEPVMREGGLGIVKSGEEYDAVIEDLKRRCEEVPRTYWPMILFTAQKPLE
ncbi:hypothetical protein NP233_g3715 [Leucocoprinus birnbaumii]|uniref:Methyltransferase domain-containing protein n=1 Tax=Leucocoprinus birnbaumii TaxID=56174 RepID=A0AAD5W2L6_9AGAR|nr:hypothetical protein NP233_g3715 [Leucocoprinus birnbaumii]